jgi:DNA-directed RNA polymerase subunit RPC12/RpoP
MKWGDGHATYRCTNCRKIMRFRERAQPFDCPRCESGYLIRLGRPTEHQLREHETAPEAR